jgi:glycine hydroxymethyltransferase
MERIVAHAALLADTLAGLGWRPVSGGTDNHLVLVDLRSKGLTGDVAEAKLEAAGLLANRNPIPFDPEPVSRTSGLRLGATGIALRGLGPDEVVTVGRLIDGVLVGAVDPVDGRAEVERMARSFPLPDRPA